MKNIINLLFIIILCVSCNKTTDLSHDYSYSDSELTKEQVISNYLQYVEGEISLYNDNYIGAEKNQQANNFGTFAAYVRTSLDDPNTLLKTKYVLLNNKKLIPTITPFNYFTTGTDLFTEDNTTSMQLYGLDDKKIIEFNVKNAKPILLDIENNIFKRSPDMPDIIAKWNADNTNKLGVAIYISGDNVSKWIQSEDIGEINLKDQIPNSIGQYDVKIFRGSILINKGSDGRNYKFTCITKSTEIVSIY